MVSEVIGEAVSTHGQDSSANMLRADGWWLMADS